MEWDTAAAHAVCAAAGCSVVSVPEQEELTYNKEDLRNPWFVVYRNPGLRQYFDYFDVLHHPG